MRLRRVNCQITVSKEQFFLTYYFSHSLEGLYDIRPTNEDYTQNQNFCLVTVYSLRIGYTHTWARDFVVNE